VFPDGGNGRNKDWKGMCVVALRDIGEGEEVSAGKIGTSWLAEGQVEGFSLMWGFETMRELQVVTSYIDVIQPYQLRQADLERYCFSCECGLCKRDRARSDIDPDPRWSIRHRGCRRGGTAKMPCGLLGCEALYGEM
jgi:hypothetical protein